MARIEDIRIHAPLVYAEGIILMIVCSLMVFLRFYARKITGSHPGLDDIAIAIALVLVIAMCITAIAETALKGFGYAAAVGDAGVGHPDANVAGWPGELIQVPALGCIKLSFLFLYRRVFTKRVAKQFSWANWFMIAVVVSWMIGYFFTLLFLCGTDFKAYWTSSFTEEHFCLPTAPVHLGYAISDVITDILTILLPVGEILKLHLPTSRKFAVLGVFGLGAITICMSIIRMAIYHGALTVQFDPDADFEYITTLTSYFSLLEAGLGVCAACLPVQYGLLRSEKVQSIIRSVHSLASLGSNRTGDSQGTRASRRSRSQSQRIPDINGSQASELNAPLPTHAAEAGYDPKFPHHEMGNMNGGKGIVVSKTFETQEQAV